MRLPPTGTSCLLDTLSPYLDDEFIDDLFPRMQRQGRHPFFRPSQLFRVSLLGLLTPAHSYNLLVELLPENRAWRNFGHLPNKRQYPDAKALHQFRVRLGPGRTRCIQEHLLRPLLEGLNPLRKTVAIMDATDLPAATNRLRKHDQSRCCSAQHAALGVRTVKSGQSRWFIGYKKHTLRLWIGQPGEAVLLVPLMTWVAPANRGDVLFLEPSLRLCQRRLQFVPDLVVGDLAYMDAAAQRRLRQQLHVAIITSLRKDFHLSKSAEPALTFRCQQGQQLEWLGLHEKEQLHWFVVRSNPVLCPWCWEQSSCPREFAFAPEENETVLGSVPVNSRVAQRLLRQVRKWIEAAQSYEKNQLGLSAMFLNSLRLAWTMGLLADTVCLLRAHALLKSPPNQSLLRGLLPQQIEMGLE